MQGVNLATDSYQGKLLIAQPTALSSFFTQSVVLICEHHSQGAWGLMLNRPNPSVMVKHIASDLGLNYTGDEAVYIGGPVEPDGLHFIHTPDCVVHNTWWVTNTLCVSSSQDILKSIVDGKGPKRWRMVVGVSSWQAGQLEGEQTGERPWTPQHRWLTQPCPANILDLPTRHLWKGQTHNAIESSVKNFLN
jgi:putative transcriptional regulator